MKKKVAMLIIAIFIVGLTGCTKKETKQATETNAKDALMYTFQIDDDEYRFRLLDGWIKYPDPDTSVAFLVGNKDIKSFMTAGFETKEKSFETYKNDFVENLSNTASDVVVSDKPTEINDLNGYTISFTKKDAKDRTLTYHARLIDSEDYYINLAAWTSEENPSQEILTQLDKMLATFEQVN